MTHSERYQSEDASAAQLAKPLHFEFSGRTTKNRFLKAAMSELLSTWSPTDLHARGIPTTNLINVYRRWGEGGYGQIVTGNIMVEYEQLVGAGNPIIPLNACFEGERFEAFKRLAEVAKKEGSLIVGQVCHPGRQVGSKIQKNPISASDVQLMQVKFLA
jgi:2,4-dienoyl-CoA reductase-like NADH-dependent reductase (Old Yellow Enzyme family)